MGAILSLRRPRRKWLFARRRSRWQRMPLWLPLAGLLGLVGMNYAVSETPWTWGGQAPDASVAADGAEHACTDFATWWEAQSFYRAGGPGDPHGLDPDGDGIACEDLH